MNEINNQTGPLVDPVNSFMAVELSTINADGKQYSTLTFNAKDASGIPVSALSISDVKFIVDGLPEGQYNLSAIQHTGDGVFVTNLSGTSPGQAVIGIEINSVKLQNFKPGKVQLMATLKTVDNNLSTLEISDAIIAANGQDISTVTLTAVNYQGQPILGLSSTEVGFYAISTLDEKLFTMDSFAEGNNGTYTIKVKGSAVGSVMVGVNSAPDIPKVSVTMIPYNGPALTCDYPVINGSPTKTASINDQTFNQSDATAPIKGGSGGKLIATSSDSNVVSIEPLSNRIIIKNVGTTVIKITEIAHGVFVQQHIEYTLIISHSYHLTAPSEVAVAKGFDKFEVQVTDESGTVASNQNVTLTQDGHIVSTGTTDSEGKVMLAASGVDGIYEGTKTGTITLVGSTQTASIKLHYLKELVAQNDRDIDYNAPVSIALTSPAYGNLNYSSTDSGVVSVDSTTGAIVCHKTGQATITVTFNLYGRVIQTISFKLTVYDYHNASAKLFWLDSNTTWPSGTLRSISIETYNRFNEVIPIDKRNYPVRINTFLDTQYNDGLSWHAEVWKDSAVDYQSGVSIDKAHPDPDGETTIVQIANPIIIKALGHRAYFKFIIRWDGDNFGNAPQYQFVIN